MQLSLPLRAWLDRAAEAPAAGGLPAELAAHLAARAALPSPLVRAAFGGASASTFGAAFLFGYRAALDVVGGPPEVMVALAASEAGGADPKRIETAARAGRLVGRKRFITGGPLAERLIVVAREGEADGRPVLGAYAISAGAAGVSLREMPALPFVPEIPHAELTLDVSLADAVRLPGDGYADLLKPFRTLEDTYVGIGTTAYLVAEAHRRRAEPVVEAGLSLLLGGAALAALDPRAPETHLALAGWLELGRRWLDDWMSWAATAAPPLHLAMERDRALLSIAGTVRELRRRRAHERRQTQTQNER